VELGGKYFKHFLLASPEQFHTIFTSLHAERINAKMFITGKVGINVAEPHHFNSALAPI
jgi:hypothetical protein